MIVEDYLFLTFYKEQTRLLNPMLFHFRQDLPLLSFLFGRPLIMARELKSTKSAKQLPDGYSVVVGVCYYYASAYELSGPR